ncbi:DMT family transporter [Fusibacter sp. JL216-2]|uniref:DMT family transporter n=1 Tax=Fusibacter sp. JL216-2 TaxID=3071453 RepID=UPI003D33D428
MKDNLIKKSNHTMKKTSAYISAVLFSVFIGLSFLFMKMALAYAEPVVVLAHRFAIGAGVFAVYRAFTGQRLRVKWAEILEILPVAIFYPVLFFLLQGLGLLRLSSSEAGMIHAMVPVMTLILASIFLKERTTMFQKISVLLSVTGLVYIFSMKGIALESMNQTGLVFALLSALASALYGLLAKKRLKDHSYMDLTYIILLVGFIAFHMAFLVGSGPHDLWKTYTGPFLEEGYMMSIIYLSVFSSVLSSLFSTRALTVLPASQMSVFNNLATLISIGAGFLVLSEPLEGYHIIGGSLILLGVIGTNIGRVSPVRTCLKESKVKA